MSEQTNKPTPGQATVYKRKPGESVVEIQRAELRSVLARCNDNELCPEHGGNYEANAALIADAFNTLHTTGLTPRQLAEQRGELIAILKDGEKMLDKLTGENLAVYARTFAALSRAILAKCGKGEA